MSVVHYHETNIPAECPWYRGTVDKHVAVEGSGPFLLIDDGEDFRGAAAFWRNEDGTVRSDTSRYSRLMLPANGEMVVVRGD